MKLTVDSAESLDDVLRVIGSLYGVELTRADGSIGSKTSASRAKRAPTKARTASPRRRSTSGSSGSVDPKVIRQWAWENGHDVSARGSLPAAVRDAYQAANPT